MPIPRSLLIPILVVALVLVAAIAAFYRPKLSPPPQLPKPVTLAVRPFAGSELAANIAGNIRTRLSARLNPNSTYVLTGTLQITGESLQLDCQLKRTAEPAPFWSQHFESPVAEALEHDAASAVGAALKRPPLNDQLLVNRISAQSYAAHARSLWNPAHHFPHQEIIAEYRRALARDPLLADAHSELSWVLFHAGPADTAVEEAQQAVDFDPENAEFRFRLSIAKIYAAQYQDAIDLLKTIPKTLHPLLWYYHAAWAHLELRQTTRANYYLEEYGRLYGVDTDGLMSSVNAMLQARYNNPHQASLAIAAALEDPGDHGYFHHTAYNVARAYELLGNDADAQFWLKQAERNGLPQHPPLAKVVIKH